MARVEIEVNGADEVARALQNADRLADDFDRVAKRGAQNLKNEYVRDAKSDGHYKHFHRSISYDRTAPLEYEVGPDKDKIQGALGNLLYFGRSNTAGVLNFEDPIRNEQPRFVKALGDVAKGVL